MIKFFKLLFIKMSLKPKSVKSIAETIIRDKKLFYVFSHDSDSAESIEYYTVKSNTYPKLNLKISIEVYFGYEGVTACTYNLLGDSNMDSVDKRYISKLLYEEICLPYKKQVDFEFREYNTEQFKKDQGL